MFLHKHINNEIQVNHGPSYRILPMLRRTSISLFRGIFSFITTIFFTKCRVLYFLRVSKIGELQDEEYLFIRFEKTGLVSINRHTW